jgi:hypothetical protein
MNDEYGLIAAVFSAIATFLAAVAAWRAPITAAKLAETLRRESERKHERQTYKLQLFSTLMQERAAFYSEDGVRSLNLIDVVFNDCPAVREAWADLFHSFEGKNNVPEHARQERFRKLLAEIAQDIGLSDKLRTDDFGRVYFPTPLAQDRMIKDMERRRLLQQLQNETSPSANNSGLENPLWPPNPS